MPILPISTEGRLILGLRGSRATRLKWLSRPFAFQIHRIMSLRSLPGEFSRSQRMAKATQITSATKRWRASGEYYAAKGDGTFRLRRLSA
jgi:hypothetical protein